MAVQATGAMAMVVADVPAIRDATDPARALFTLAVLTGVAMLVAGLLRLGFESCRARQPGSAQDINPPPASSPARRASRA